MSHMCEKKRWFPMQLSLSVESLYSIPWLVSVTYFNLIETGQKIVELSNADPFISCLLSGKLKIFLFLTIAFINVKLKQVGHAVHNIKVNLPLIQQNLQWQNKQKQIWCYWLPQTRQNYAKMFFLWMYNYVVFSLNSCLNNKCNIYFLKCSSWK